MEEAGRLYKIQTQSLDAAQEAIHASRNRLESAYSRLAELRANVLDNIKEDGKLVTKEPMRVKSERTKAAIAAPKKAKATKKKAPAAKASEAKGFFNAVFTALNSRNSTNAIVRYPQSTERWRIPDRVAGPRVTYF